MKHAPTFALEYLDPSEFSSLDAVRDFLGGDGGAAMTQVLMHVVSPEDEADAPMFPKGFVRAARWAAWHIACDMGTLARVLAAGEAARATRALNHCQEGRPELLAFVLGDEWTEELKQQFVRYLAAPVSDARAEEASA